MRPIILLAALSSSLLLASDPAGAAWDGRPFAAEFVTSNAQAGGQDMTGRVYVDRPGMRMEQTTLGQQAIVLVRFGQQSTTLLMPAAPRDRLRELYALGAELFRKLVEVILWVAPLGIGALMRRQRTSTA